MAGVRELSEVVTKAQLLSRWLHFRCRIWVPLLTHCFSVISENVIRPINNILPKTRFCDYIICSRQCGSNFDDFDVLAPKLPNSVK